MSPTLSGGGCDVGDIGSWMRVPSPLVGQSEGRSLFVVEEEGGGWGYNGRSERLRYYGIVAHLMVMQVV